MADDKKIILLWKRSSLPARVERLVVAVGGSILGLSFSRGFEPPRIFFNVILFDWEAGADIGRLEQ